MNPAPTLQTVNPQGLGDEQLVDLALKGEGIAFRQIMQRHNRRLYRTVRGILGDDAEAEDIVQEVYMRAFQHLASFRRQSALGTWLTRIAINEALGRKRKRRKTIELSHLDKSDNLQETRVVIFPAVRGNPEAETGRAEIRRLLEWAIDDLPEPFRVVFVLREVEQMSVEEAAAYLHLKPETVKTRLHRARRLLRTSLGERLGSALRDAYSFDGWRCERLTNAVMRRLSYQI